MQSKLKLELIKNKIQLNYSKLNNAILGCYYSIDDLDLIVINESIKSNTKQLNCVIAEELGHYFTTHGNCGPYSCNESNDKINHSRVELRALKWAVNFLIPTNDLLKYISVNHDIDHITLCDYFEVTENFIMRKFYYMSLIKNQYQLSNNRYLVVSNYPNIFIYKDYNERSFEYGNSTKAR